MEAQTLTPPTTTRRSEVHLLDCMEGMKQYPDNYFDLAVVDPPYGIGYDLACSKHNGKKFGGQTQAKRSTYHSSGWDNQPPSLEYFNELIRISDNQIIWGWNHFVSNFDDCPSFIVWNKKTNGNFSDCESAWCSKKGPARVFEYLWNGMIQQDMKNKDIRIHPTQKPVALYDWIFKNYAAPGQLILDTHMGSQSSRISAYKAGLDYVGYELDPEYFEQGCKRFADFTAQTNLFY